MRTHWVVLWSLWAARFVRQPTLPVRVSGGLLRGDIAPDGNHRRYMGVPYAMARAEHRFKDADSEYKWNGVYEAVNEHIRCPQIMYGFLGGQEDCLILNIFTPMDVTPTSKLPVMVYIFGGGYMEGSNSIFLYGPDYLMTKNVILVTMNHRLYVQGFLCLRTKEAPGNAGMKDQVLALKWVQKNIRAFGGDPDNVTLFGISSGASAVSYHILSPMSKGLFHKAIMQSGSSLNPWSLELDPVKKASLLANVMGLISQDPHKIYEFFMSKTDDEIIWSRIPREEGNIQLSEVHFVPCVETKIDGVEPFLTETPIDIFIKGTYNKVPVIVGSTDEEGLMFIARENHTLFPTIDFKKSLPVNWAIPTQKEREEIAAKLNKTYMNDKPISRDTMFNFSTFLGEVFFSYPVLAETELLATTNDKPVFSYLFKYDGFRNFAKFNLIWPVMIAPGACHADDLFYIFIQNPPISVSMFEYKMITQMTTMWTNFAKYGDPTPQKTDLLPVKWQPINNESLTSLVIDKEFSTTPLWSSPTLKYLREVYKKYRRRY